jgi:hypothetical protein
MTRISQDKIPQTIENVKKQILPAFKLKPTDLKVLGSAGKKAPGETSGDIDIGIKMKSLMHNNKVKSEEEIWGLINKVFSGLKSKRIVNDFSVNKGLGTIPFSYKIAGSKDLVQVDFMLMTNLDWADFAYHSDDWKSTKWKGVYRNLLLSSVAKYARFKGDEVNNERLTLNINKGLYNVKRTHEGPGGKILKNPKELSKEFVTNVPSETAEILFGKVTKPADLSNFEKVFALVMSPSFISKKYRTNILKESAAGFEKAGLPLPPEYAKELKKLK